jgi:hypothetical protein
MHLGWKNALGTFRRQDVAHRTISVNSCIIGSRWATNFYFSHFACFASIRRLFVLSMGYGDVVCIHDRERGRRWLLVTWEGETIPLGSGSGE